MPRYFFHVHHKGCNPDREGTEFTDDAEAWRNGTRACGEWLKDLDGRLSNGPEYWMECVDDAGRAVFDIRFSADKHF